MYEWYGFIIAVSIVIGLIMYACIPFRKKGYTEELRYVCRHCGLMAMDEKDIQKHLELKHPNSKYLTQNNKRVEP